MPGPKKIFASSLAGPVYFVFMRILAWVGFAAAAGCGPGLVDDGWTGAPLVTLEARLDLAADVALEGPVEVAIQWYARPINALSSVIEPPEPERCDGAFPWLSERTDTLDETEWVSETRRFEPEFPLRMRIPIFEPPPVPVQGDLLDLGGEGRWAVGVLLAFSDEDDSGRFEPPSPAEARDRVLGLPWVEGGRSRRVLFLDGTLPDGHPLAPLGAGLHVVDIDRELERDFRQDVSGPIALTLPRDPSERGPALLSVCGRSEQRVRLGGPVRAGDPVQCSDDGRRFVAGQVEYEPDGTPCVVEHRWTAACVEPGATRPAGWPCP